MIRQNVSLVNTVRTITDMPFVCISLIQGIGEVVMTVLNVPSTKNGQEDADRDSGAIMSKNKSILYDDKLDRCYICGAYGKMDEHHIFGGPCRKASDRLGLVVHLCRSCHRDLHDRNSDTMLYLHQKGQMIYEEHIGSRQEFIKEFIRSYL